MELAADFEADPDVSAWLFPKGGFEWVYGRDCRSPGVYGPFLIARGSPGPVALHRYRLQRSPAVLDEFLALAANPTDETMLNFANHRGWLGRPVATYPRFATTTYEEAQKKFAARTGPKWTGAPISPLTYEKGPLLGEPPELWRRALSKMVDLDLLREHLERCEAKSSDVEQSRWFLRDRLSPIEGGFLLRYGGPVPVDDEVAETYGGGRGRVARAFQADQLPVPNEAVDRGKLGDTASVARAALEIALEKELRAHTYVHVSADHKRIEWTHAGLLTVLYFHMLQRLVSRSTGMRRTRVCLRPGCGVTFAYERDTAKWCSPKCRERVGADLRRAHAAD